MQHMQQYIPYTILCHNEQTGFMMSSYHLNQSGSKEFFWNGEIDQKTTLREGLKKEDI